MDLVRSAIRTIVGHTEHKMQRSVILCRLINMWPLAKGRRGAQWFLESWFGDQAYCNPHIIHKAGMLAAFVLNRVMLPMMVLISLMCWHAFDKAKAATEEQAFKIIHTGIQ